MLDEDLGVRDEKMGVMNSKFCDQGARLIVKVQRYEVKWCERAVCVFCIWMAVPD